MPSKDKRIGINGQIVFNIPYLKPRFELWLTNYKAYVNKYGSDVEKKADVSLLPTDNGNKVRYRYLLANNNII